ncbi:MAG: bifunctional DNA primase/polymerase [Pseudonocardiales bacterium]|nr:bifunctional DNA primase/polymerase [Pseudonocardiales bacterium]
MSGTKNKKMTVAGIELRSAALSATRRGWPVVPGTFLGTDRRWHGRDNASRLCPISDTWQDSPITDPDQAYEIWSEHPYGVLLDPAPRPARATGSPSCAAALRYRHTAR